MEGIDKTQKARDNRILSYILVVPNEAFQHSIFSIKENPNELPCLKPSNNITSSDFTKLMLNRTTQNNIFTNIYKYEQIQEEDIHDLRFEKIKALRVLFGWLVFALKKPNVSIYKQHQSSFVVFSI